MAKPTLVCYDNITDRRVLLPISVSSIEAWRLDPDHPGQYTLRHRLVGGGIITWLRNEQSLVCISIVTPQYPRAYRCIVTDLDVFLSAAKIRTPVSYTDHRP